MRCIDHDGGEEGLRRRGDLLDGRRGGLDADRVKVGTTGSTTEDDVQVAVT